MRNTLIYIFHYQETNFLLTELYDQTTQYLVTFSLCACKIRYILPSSMQPYLQSCNPFGEEIYINRGAIFSQISPFNRQITVQFTSFCVLYNQHPR